MSSSGGKTPRRPKFKDSRNKIRPAYFDEAGRAPQRRLTCPLRRANEFVPIRNITRCAVTYALTAALALLIPTIPNRIKEFAYSGFAITLISAVIAHSSSGDGISSLDPLLFLGILIVSYFYYYKTQLYKQPAGYGTDSIRKRSTHRDRR